MKQYAETFKRYYLTDQCVSTQLNKFLKEHPNYRVAKICYNSSETTTCETLFVVFDIEEQMKD